MHCLIQNFICRFKETRRYSNIDVCEKIAPPIPARRRASELPPSSAPGKTAASQSSGIVCTNTDLMSMLNSLTSTAGQALQQPGNRPGTSKTTDSLPPAAADVDRRRDVLRANRSNSVDVANLGATTAIAVATAAGNTTRNWFRKMSARTATAVTCAVSASGPRTTDAECVPPELCKRPATIGGSGGGGEYVVQKSPVVVTFADERPKVSLLQEPIACCKPDKQPLAPPAPPQVHSVDGEKSESKCDDVVVWDRPTGSVVNAEMLGTAIEGFLAAKKSGDSGDASPADGAAEQLPQQQQQQLQQQQQQQKPVAKATTEPNSGRTCDTSICSSLKDLFVK